MPTHPTPPFSSLCLLTLALAAPFAASAQEPSQTLQERRLGLIKGTSKGVVIYEFGKSEPATPTAPAAHSASGATASSAPAAKASNPAAPQAPAKSGFLGALPPPSGKPLNAARRLDAPDQGIALPTAQDKTKGLAESASKP